MFGKKQDTVKELEERLSQVQSEMETLQAALAQIRGSAQQMVPFFELQIAAQSEMDRELTKVVSHACDTIESAGESIKALEQIAMELTSMRGQLEDEEKENKKLCAAAQKQKEQIDVLTEENKQKAEPVKIIRDIQGGLLQDAEKVRGTLNQMVDYAKQMTVSSLNCAIEAGRMGEAGRKFIGASEEVRVLSSAYERAAASAIQQMDSIDGRIRRLEEQAGGLHKSQKDTDAQLERLSRMISQQEAVSAQAAERHNLQKAAVISDFLKKISQNHDKIDALQHQTLADIEHLGESFMDEQEARREMEHIIDEIRKTVSG